MTWLYVVLDLVFTLAALWFFLNNQVTNALVCWCISEVYNIERKAVAHDHS